jgi:nucleoside-diphosphate-sugar epimerase
MKKLNILITGAAGFVGSNLGDYLTKKGHNVIGVDNFMHSAVNQDDVNFNLVYGDVRYSEDLDQRIKESDLIYHLAAQINVDKSISHPQETMDINLGGTQNVLNICRRYCKKMVFASTSEVYGTHNTSISEEHQTHAQSPYAVSKLAADKLCGNYHDLYGLEVYRMRCFNIFGPRQSSDTYGAVIPIFVKKMIYNESPIIFGDGHQKRDYIYIDDVVRAYEILPTKSKFAGTPINIGTGKSVEIIEIARMINKILDTHTLFKCGPARSGEVRKLEANINFVKKNYNFKPEVSFKEGLRRYIEWVIAQQR